MTNVDDIKKKFRQVIRYSQDIENPKVDELFERWQEAKKNFIHIFDNKLIYTYPDKVTFELGEEEKNQKVANLIERVRINYKNEPLSDFIFRMRKSFFSNIMPEDYLMDNGTVIKAGTKIIKAFKYFEPNKDRLMTIQDAASRIIQENKVEGYLCLSVHPLDYLSLSENNCNWRSCHALDGDYRAGNLSYMVDSATVVCYLRSEKEEPISDFPFFWNNKKWRVLLYFSSDAYMVFAGRQYPFFSDNGIKFVLSSLLPAANLGQWKNGWHDATVSTVKYEDGDSREFHLTEPFYPVGNGLVRQHDLVQDEPGSMHFNDVLRSSCYKPIYAFKWISYNPEKQCGNSSYTGTRFHIGGKVNCLRCGVQPIRIESTMQCIDCEEQYGHAENDDFNYCTFCGRHLYVDHGTWVDNEWLCEDCIKENCSFCDICGWTYFNEEVKYYESENQNICTNCATERGLI
jgi:hypothetical protein